MYTWASDNTLLSAAVFLAAVCGVMLPLTSAHDPGTKLNELRERVKQADALLEKNLMPEDRLRVAKLRALDQIEIMILQKTHRFAGQKAPVGRRGSV
jgi:hypothetical protein